MTDQASTDLPAHSVSARDVIARLRKGDEAGFKAFFDANYRHLYRFALIRLDRNEQAALKAVRGTLSEAVRNVVSLHSDAHAGVPTLIWVLRICRLEIREYKVRQARETHRRAPVQGTPALDAPLSDDDAGNGEARDLQNSEERLREFVGICDQLPELEGAALELKYVGNCSNRDVARLLDLTVPAAQDLLVRARAMFQRLLNALSAAKVPTNQQGRP